MKTATQLATPYAKIPKTYAGLMGIHLFTGLSAFGYVSNTLLKDLGDLPGQLLAIVV